jgi:16S rRNA (adenine1518-N6/adenine1519-N6)-dimethyltransferase
MATKPKLGQNFLRDPQAIERIVAALGEIGARTVVEIGPGQGAITELLAARAKRLIAVEYDAELARRLRRRFGIETETEPDGATVTVCRQDVLLYDFSAAASEAGEPLLVVGNLPYYITSPILLHLARHAAALDRAVLMVQREVADRVTAQPGSRDYGLLTVTMQLYGKTQALFTLPPEAFLPPPEVHSTVFRWSFAPRFVELGIERGAGEASFLSFLKQAFQQKRKTLSNNLRAAGYTPAQVAAALGAAEVDGAARAETLSLEQFARLWKLLKA